jgi:hypothetical protein
LIHLAPIAITATLVGWAGLHQDISGIVFAVILGGCLCIVLFERIRIKRLMVGCTILKTSFSFLAMLFCCREVAKILLHGNYFDDGFELVLPIAAWVRYRWHIPALIRKRNGAYSGKRG